VKIFVTRSDILRAYGVTNRMFRKMRDSHTLNPVEMPGYNRAVYYRAGEVEAKLGVVEKWHDGMAGRAVYGLGK